MNVKQSVLALALVGLSAAGVVQAVSPPPPTRAEIEAAQAAQPPAPATTPAPAVDRAVERARLTPMHREIADAVETEQAAVEALNRRFLEAPQVTEKMAIQKEIEAIKKNGMLAVFEIQLRYAVADGRTAAAEQLRTTIEAMKNPKVTAEDGR
jgi:hypothetical protein